MGLSYFEIAAKERFQVVTETALHPSGVVATTGHDCLWSAIGNTISVMGKGDTTRSLGASSGLFGELDLSPG